MAQPARDREAGAERPPKTGAARGFGTGTRVAKLRVCARSGSSRVRKNDERLRASTSGFYVDIWVDDQAGLFFLRLPRTYFPLHIVSFHIILSCCMDFEKQTIGNENFVQCQVMRHVLGDFAPRNVTASVVRMHILRIRWDDTKQKCHS